MIEFLLVFCCALLLGVLSGLLPGIGGFAIMVAAYPFLIHLDPVNIILFYITLVSIDQFFGGITSIVFGIPGFAASAPTIYEGHELFLKGRGSDAIIYSAFASYFASIFSVILIFLFLPYMWVLYKMWNTNVQAIILLFASTALVLFSRNNILISILLFIVGNFLAHVGWDEFNNSEFYTFGFVYLYSGIPLFPLLIMLFVLPNLVNSYISYGSSKINFIPFYFESYFTYIKNMKQYFGTLVRSSLLGSFGGLVPGLTYGMSTLLAYSIERYYQIKKKVYTKGNMSCLIAAEGSNNAGALTQLIPLLFLGIPITGSEALIYNILETRGMPVSIEWFQSTFSLVIFTFILSATIGVFIAGKYINFLKFLNGMSLVKVYIFLGFLLFIMIGYTGYVNFSLEKYLIISFLLLPIGLLLYRFDTMPLIYGFVLHDLIYQTFIRINAFYF